MGKTIKEWEQEAKDVTGINEEGNPAWWEPQANATYGMATATMLYDLYEDKDEI